MSEPAQTQEQYMQEPHMQQPVMMQSMAAQPMMTTPTVHVITQQPGSAAYPQNVREFSTGLCGCCSDMKSCLLGTFCLSCLACNVAGRLNEDCCCTGCCLAPVTWVAMRTKLRAMFGIRGSITMDYYCIYCCAPLAVCQMARELEHFGH